MAAGIAGMVVRMLQTLETSLKFKPTGFADKLHVKCKTNKQKRVKDILRYFDQVLRRMKISLLWTELCPPQSHMLRP